MLKKQYLKDKPTCKVTFSLPVEAVNGATEVKLVGEFNGWNKTEGILMKATKSEFKTVLELETGRNYEFRYLIDNNTWENDWAADDYIPTPFGGFNSVVTVETLDVPAKPATKTKKTTAKKTTAPKAKKPTTTKKATTKTATTAKKAATKTTPTAKKATTKTATTAKKATITTKTSVGKKAANTVTTKDELKGGKKK